MKRKPSNFLFLLFTIFIFSFAESNAQYLIEQDFSSATYPPTGWTQVNPSGLLSRQTASAYGIGTGSVRANNYNVSAGNFSTLTSPSFTGAILSDTLSFDYAYTWYDDDGEIYRDDSLWVQFSTNNGSSFIDLAAIDLDDIATTTPINSNFVPAANQWARLRYSVPAGAIGNTCQVRLQFRSNFGNSAYVDNIRVGKPPAIDIAVLSTNTFPDLYVKGTSYTGMSTVINNGTAPATFTVTRKITPGGYTSTKNVIGLTGGANTNVVFDPFTFVSGTTYTVKDSASLVGDSNPANDTLSAVTKLNTAKMIGILRIHQVSVDSLWAQLNRMGYGGQIDTVSTLMPLTGWTTVFVPFQSASFWSGPFRDLMQDYLATAPTPGVGEFKRSLLIFGNDIGYQADPSSPGYSGVPADSVFYRQYMKSMYVSDSWLVDVPAANGKFQGRAPYFSPSLVDSVGDPYPDMVRPVNGGSAAFIPLTTTTGDSACAIAYSSSTYNMFYGSNVYSNYYADASPLDAPIDVLGAINAFLDANGGALPVELASFTATVSQRDVNLNWSTVGEQNNSGYDIERKSIDGNWSKVGFVNGSGTTSEARTYSFTDVNVNSGKYNYRLKQIDYNGNYEYFNLSSEIIVGIPGKFELSQNYPNPFNPVTKINYDLPIDGKIMLKVYDITGREIAQLVNEIQTAGYYTVTFNASNFASGVYFYKIFANGNNGQQYLMTKKMMLIK